MGSRYKRTNIFHIDLEESATGRVERPQGPWLLGKGVKTIVSVFSVCLFSCVETQVYGTQVLHHRATSPACFLLFILKQDLAKLPWLALKSVCSTDKL